jgi:hypothetical protein
MSKTAASFYYFKVKIILIFCWIFTNFESVASNHDWRYDQISFDDTEEVIDVSTFENINLKEIILVNYL